MIVPIDNKTRLRLRALEGARITRVVARRYPNPMSYDRVELVVDDGTVTVVELRSEDVSDKLEVCCITAHVAPSVVASDASDEFRLGDFQVDEVLVLRRAEWLEPPEEPVDVVGENPEQQRYGEANDVPAWLPHALVDAGVLFVDHRGSRLLLEADTFPLVMQCHYTVAPTTLPRGEARSIGA
jgi:hypothetical protein